MQLKVLPYSNIRNASRVPLRNLRNRANLVAAQQPVRNSNAHHEVRRGLTFSAAPADDPRAVSLCVHTPGPEIRPHPFRRDRSIALARELTDLVEVLPGILLAFQTLHALRFGLFDFAHRSITCPKHLSQKQKTHVA